MKTTNTRRDDNNNNRQTVNFFNKSAKLSRMNWAEHVAPMKEKQCKQYFGRNR